MSRIARIEIIGYPYHVVQRGNRNQKVFIKGGDKARYLHILKVQADLFGVDIWAYCLMDNHVHLIVMPKQKGALTECISETHRSYTRMVNFREDWRGHLWQGRFRSYPMDARYLWAAVRYVERNPVRAGIVDKAEDYSWSSAKAHVKRQKDEVLNHFYLLDEIRDWGSYLSEADEQKSLKSLETHQRTGRPLGDKAFVDDLEIRTGRVLAKRKPGPAIKVTVGVP
ncbi:MAG: transposase [Candidatus Omnitrophota bacterium]|nr:transposase [Candidatus Omnitrophota bacterium]